MIGGGRWAGEIARIVVALAPASRRILLCSPGNPDIAHRRAAEFAVGDAPDVRAADFESILADDGIGRVLIARAARDHAATAEACLRAGKAVFVEKPFALSEADATRLVRAVQNGRDCVTGLVFLFASNLRAFAGGLAPLGPIRSLRLVWCDPASDVRRGQPKRYDASLNLVQDVFPHVWSILRVLDPAGAIVLERVEAVAGARECRIGLRLGDAMVEVELARDATARRREIKVRGMRGTAEIDFAREPGTAVLDGRPLDIAAGFEGPLTVELRHFLQGRAYGPDTRFCHIERAIESIVLADAMLATIRAQQCDLIVGALGGAASPDEATRYAFREIALDHVARRGGAGADYRYEFEIEAWAWLARGMPASLTADRLAGSPWIETIRRRLVR